MALARPDHPLIWNDTDQPYLSIQTAWLSGIQWNVGLMFSAVYLNGVWQS